MMLDILCLSHQAEPHNILENAVSKSLASPKVLLSDSSSAESALPKKPKLFKQISDASV